jgi:hypothetical protein
MIDSNKQVDYTHVETLDILYFKKLNKHILFVPDEFSPTPAQTLALVKQKLKDAYIEAVDVCLLHGYFDFQVPPEIKTIQAHSSEEYSKIVLGPVLSGHVHERTRYKNIEPHGSFDRIAHNEEAPKGYLRGVIFDNNSYEVSFIENKNAAIYKTLICNQTNMEDTLVYLQKTIKKYRHGSRIKIRAVSTHPIFANKKVVREMFPDHVLDFDSKKPKKQLEKIMSNTASDPCVTINKTTIKELVSKKINASDKLPHNLRDKCMTTLSTIMESIGGH